MSDPSSVITDAREWRYFKMLTNTKTGMLGEERSLSLDMKCLFVRAGIITSKSADEGSSPKRLVIQALGYILYLTKFMYSLSFIELYLFIHFALSILKLFTLGYNSSN